MLGALQKLAKKNTGIDYQTFPGDDFPREKEILQLMILPNQWKCMEKNFACVAGGAINSLFTRTKINDLDIFFTTDGHNYLKNVSKSLKNDSAHDFETVNAITVNTFIEDDSYGERHKLINGVEEDPYDWETGVHVIIQLVKPEICSGTTEEVLTTFDFTCCMGGYNFAEDMWYFHPQFFAHNASRTLIYNDFCDRNHLNSLLRTEKYQKRGYSVSVIQMMKMVLSIQNRYETFGQAIKSVTYTNRQLKHLRSNVVKRGYEDAPFNFENFTKLINECRLNNL